MFNLFEGNVSMGFGSDGYFGSASHNTLFRNWFYASHPSLEQNVNAINLNRWSYHFSLVGNILGDPSFPAAPDGLFTTAEESFSYFTRLIYKLGYPNMGNNAFDGTYNPPSTSEQAFDLNVRSTLLRHGNYDFATKSVIWDPTISETNLPASLYLRGKPDWWGNLPWPAIGPDLTPMTGRIPAQYRIRTGTLILLN